jgi:predicted GTPase
MSAASLDAFAASLRSAEREISATTVGTLVPTYGADWPGALVVRLRSIASRLEARTVTVTFGGHFSSGKSTVINALLGRPLLPTSDYPETGVPCTISAGKADRVVIVRENRTEDLDFRTEAIASVVSLIDSGGSYRPEIRDIRQLDVTLANGSLPRGITLVDSPGINDTAAMTERAAAAARRADIVLWVVNSGQPLAETEQAFLGEHMAGSTAALVMLVNAFLPAETEQRWRWFLAERGPRLRVRIDEALRPDNSPEVPPPPVMFMSARAALSGSGDYGVASVRELVTGLRRDSPRVRAARVSAAVVELTALTDEVDSRLRQERKRHERNKAELAKAHAEAEKRRKQFEQAVLRHVAAAFDSQQAAAAESVSAIVTEIGSGSLHRDGTYGRTLTRRLQAVTEQTAAHVLDGAARSARRYGQPEPSNDTGRRLRSLLAPASVEIEVPDYPVVSRKAAGGGKGALVGGIIGSIFFPGAGTAIGAAIGAGLGAAAGEDGVATAVAKDRAGAQSNARVAGRTAMSTLARKQEAVQDLILGEYPAPRALSARAPASLTALKQLHATLGTLQDTGRRLASTHD